MNNPLSELQALARDLDLTTLAEGLAEYLQKAEKGHPAYTDFALGLLRTELHARKARRMERILKRARLGSVEDLETFDFSIRPKLEARIIKELCTCRFVEERRNVLRAGRVVLDKKSRGISEKGSAVHAASKICEGP